MSGVSHDKGFSLIEVVVALGVLSTAAIGFSSLARGSLAGTSQLESRYFATIIADNQLTEALTQDTPLRIGVIEGESEQMGRTLDWVQTVSQTTQAGLMLVEIEVSDPLTEDVLIRTSTLKVAEQ